MPKKEASSGTVQVPIFDTPAYAAASKVGGEIVARVLPSLLLPPHPQAGAGSADRHKSFELSVSSSAPFNFVLPIPAEVLAIIALAVTLYYTISGLPSLKKSSE